MIQEQSNQENKKFSILLEAFLRNSGQTVNTTTNERHLDEDTMAAFVEGSLTRRESEPLLKHLVRCSPCRGITAQLARLTEELNEAPETVAATSQPTRLKEILSGFFSRNFSFGDEAVFAHNEKQDEDSAEAKDDVAEKSEENKS